jgi:putative endonuclease
MFFNRTGSRTPTGADAKNITPGSAAEARAELFLQQQGMITQEKNYRSKQGEIDLIMMQDDEIIFVEVRLRSHRQFATAAESVTSGKQQKIIRTAHHYLQQHQLTEKAHCRFDVIAFSDNHSSPEWIKNAFSAY